MGFLIIFHDQEVLQEQLATVVMFRYQSNQQAFESDNENIGTYPPTVNKCDLCILLSRPIITAIRMHINVVNKELIIHSS